MDNNYFDELNETIKCFYDRIMIDYLYPCVIKEGSMKGDYIDYEFSLKFIYENKSFYITFNDIKINLDNILFYRMFRNYFIQKHISYGVTINSTYSFDLFFDLIDKGDVEETIFLQSNRCHYENIYYYETSRAAKKKILTKQLFHVK